MKRLKRKRTLFAVLALVSLAGSFQPLGAYECGCLDSAPLALLLALVCILLFGVCALKAQAADRIIEKKKLPAGRQPRRRENEKTSIHNITPKGGFVNE